MLLHFCILFRMNEIFCMNIRLTLYRPGEKWGNWRNCGNWQKFWWSLGEANLWKSLWTVCITFCIKRENTVEGGQNRGGESNFLH